VGARGEPRDAESRDGRDSGSSPTARAPAPSPRAHRSGNSGHPRSHLRRPHRDRVVREALVHDTELVHRAPQWANEQVERLYALYEEHGDDALREAVSMVVADGPRTVSAVRTALASLGDRARVERQLVLERVSQPRGARARDAAKPSHRAERRGGSR
jgi:hypothetical protein